MGPEELEPTEGELREENVHAGDRLDDRVSEGEGLAPDPDTVHSEADDILPPADAPLNQD